MDKTIKQVGRKIPFYLTLLFFAVFFLLPLSTVVRDAFTAEDGGATLLHLRNVITSSYYLRIIGFTAFQAGVSASCAVVLGLPGAYILSHFSFRGKRFLRSITTIPFVMPSILVVLGFIILFGNNGIINRMLMNIFGRETPPLKILYSFFAIILAHVFYNFPIAMRLISSSWEHISLKNIESAKTLGAGPLFRFRTITIPRLLPGIIASWILVFLFCFLSFAVILVLGGGPQFTTTEVEVYRLARFSLDFSTAGALSLFQAVLSLAVLFGYTKVQNRLSVEERNPGGGSRKSFRDLGKNLSGRGGIITAVVLYTLVIVVVIILPMITIVFRSFQAAGGWNRETYFTLKWYKELLGPVSISGSSVTGAAILNSLIIAAASTCISLLFGLASSYKMRGLGGRGASFVQTFFLLPMGISTVLLGLGYTRIFNLFHFPGLTIVIMIMAHAVISFPFVFRSLQPTVQNINTRLLEAASTLGAGRGRIFRSIEAPLIRSSVVSAGVFAFAISIGEINTTLILAPEGFATIPIAVYRLISSYNFFAACALGTILLVLCGAAFYLVDFVLPKERL